MLSLGVAGVSTYLFKTFNNPESIEELEKEAEASTSKILVAIKPIAAGTGIKPDVVGWQAWPDEFLNEKYIVVNKEEDEAPRLKEFAFSIAKRSFISGEPILSDKVFNRDTPGFLAGMLDEGMRAVTISAGHNQMTAGFVNPGDYVDLMLTHGGAAALAKRFEGEARIQSAKNEGVDNDPGLPSLILLKTSSETFMRNLKVIAIDQRVGATAEKAKLGKSVTLEVTPKQAELITIAATMGKISLLIRSLEETSKKPLKDTYSTDLEISPLMKMLLNGSPEVAKRRADKARLVEVERQLKSAKAELKRLNPYSATKKKKTISKKTVIKKAPAKPVIAESLPVVETSTVVAEKPVVKTVSPSTVTIYRSGADTTEKIQLK